MANINFDSNKEPMAGNIGAEFDRMFPSETGYGTKYSTMGFWGGLAPIMEALRQQQAQEEGRRKARTSIDVANIGADTSNQAQLVQLMKTLYGDIPLARATLENKQSNDAMQRQIELMRMMSGNQTAIQKAKIGADATLGAAETNRQGRVEAAAGRLPPVGAPPETYRMKKIQEMINASKDPKTGKPTISADDPKLDMLANQEWIRENVDFKRQLQSQPKQPPAPAPAAAPQKTSSAGSIPTRPEDILQMMMTGAMGGGQESVNDMSSDIGDTAYAAAGVNNAAPDRAARGDFPSVNQSLPPTTSPMSRFASKPGGTEMTRRMYAPADDLVNPSGGGQVVNDPRAAARPQSLMNAQDQNFGQLPQPQSEFSRRNPEAFADLLQKQGYVVTDRDIPEGPWVRQGGGQGEDSLRAPTAMERPQTRELLYSLIFNPALGPILSKIMGGGYKVNPRTTGESPILDMLPYIVGGIGGLAGGAGRSAATQAGQKLLGRGSWASSEPLQLPGRGAAGLPGRSAQGALPPGGAGPQTIGENPWMMPPASQGPMQGLPTGGPPRLALPPGETPGPSFQNVQRTSPYPQPPNMTVPKATGKTWGMAPQNPPQGMQLGSGGFARTNISAEQALRDLLRNLYGM